ncbi:MAG: rod shape-determining protein [Bacteroidales bacterium]|nr:rod shape-determining protein [Bacteroidales bacterium]
MGIFKDDCCFEFEGSNLRVVKKGEVLFDEPARIQIDKSGRPIAIGNEISDETVGIIIYPLKAGAIADFNGFELLIRGVIKKTDKKGGSKFISFYFNTFTLVSDTVTEVEIRAVRDSMEHARARNVYMMYKPYAAIKGLGFENNHECYILINATSEKFEISVVENKEVKQSNKVPYGNKMISTILKRRMQLDKDIIVNPNDILLVLKDFNILSNSNKPIRLKGNKANGLESNIDISIEYFRELCEPYFTIIENEIYNTIVEFGEKSSSTIVSLYLIGASANEYLAKRIEKTIKIPTVLKSENDYVLEGLKYFSNCYENDPLTIR